MKYCKTCILKGQTQDGRWGCQLSNQLINLDKDYCSKHQDYVYRCDNCGVQIASANQTYVTEINGEYKTLCPNCCSMYLRGA